MKEIAGWFWPDDQPEKWVRKLPTVDGRASYSLALIRRVLASCRRRRVAVDGGAHIGLWSAPLLRAFGNVVAFEPHPDNVCCLVSNCVSQRLIVHQAALSSAEGLAKLYGDGGKSMGYSLEEFRDIEGMPPLSCRTVALDFLALENVDLIKLDVEGHEFEALQGARRTIEKWRPVIVIEEKFDAEARASRHLEGLGMVCAMRTKRDRLFVWPQ